MPVWIFVTAALSILYYYGYVPAKLVIICLAIVYWIPKFMSIDILEKQFPQVKFRNKRKRTVAITIDDLPFGSQQKIIDKMNEHNMKGTFFVVSGDVNDSNIDVFISAVKNGHQLGNHGKTNSPHFLLSEKSLREEIMHCDELIDKIYKLAQKDLPSKKIYRPGSGMYTPMMLKVVSELDYTLVLGSVFPYDPVVPFPSINLWYLQNHIEDGDIIILHDRSWTPDLLDKLLPWLMINRWRSETIDNFCFKN